MAAAEAQDKKLVAAERKLAELKTKLAANTKSQADKKRNLGAADRSERQAWDREEQRRRRDELAHVRTVARLSAPTVRYVEVREPEPEPERLRVLYLTANPDAEEITTVAPDGTVTTTWAVVAARSWTWAATMTV